MSFVELLECVIVVKLMDIVKLPSFHWLPSPFYISVSLLKKLQDEVRYYLPFACSIVFCKDLTQIVIAEPGLITWQVCDDSYYHGRITKVGIINNPVVPGLNTTVVAYGFLDKDVTSGRWSLTGSYMGVPVIHKSGDLCSDSVIDLPFRSGSIYVNGLTCPTSFGYIQVEQKAIFFQSPPSGEYSIRCKMFDQDDEPILCLDITIPM